MLCSLSHSNIISITFKSHVHTANRFLASSSSMTMRQLASKATTTAAATTSATTARPQVNALYQPGVPVCAAPAGKDKCMMKPCVCADGDANHKILTKHRNIKWTSEKFHEMSKKHVMMTWGATDAMMDSVRLRAPACRFRRRRRRRRRLFLRYVFRTFFFLFFLCVALRSLV